MIKNSSAYTLFPGESSVYLDGSFIAKNKLPLVGPQEKFNCPLGYVDPLHAVKCHRPPVIRIDPSIRVTYHPKVKKITQTGGFNIFSTKIKTTSSTQSITIHNTKTISVAGIHVLDHVPVSEDYRIAVKVRSPGLNMPVGDEERNLTLRKPADQEVTIQEGVIAKWDSGSEDGDENVNIGKDGKLKWVVNLPALEKINLVLAYDISSAANLQLVGL